MDGIQNMIQKSTDRKTGEIRIIRDRRSSEFEYGKKK